MSILKFIVGGWKVNTCSKALIPIALGLFISACSTNGTNNSSTTNNITSNASTSNNSTSVGASNKEETQSFTPQISMTSKVFTAEESDGEIKDLIAANTALKAELNEKEATIIELQHSLAVNNKKLYSLGLELDSKEALIASLESPAIIPTAKDRFISAPASSTTLAIADNTISSEAGGSNSSSIALVNDAVVVSNLEQLAALEKEKQLRNDLEAQYNALKLNNEALIKRIAELENENIILKQQIEKMRTGSLNSVALQKEYNQLLIKHQELQEAYSTLETSTEITLQELVSLQTDNAIQAKALEEARGHIAEQQTLNQQLNQDYQFKEQGHLAQLEGRVAEQRLYERKLNLMDTKLLEVQEQNLSLSTLLGEKEAELLVKQAEIDALMVNLDGVKKELDLKVNDTITMAAIMDTLETQVSVSLQHIDWQLPSEIALNDTFEILVSADVLPVIVGQTFQAELVLDSSIQMISDSVVTASVQDGRVQWRWRVSGLNESPDADLNLFVSQQINVQGKVISRQVYRGSETLSLVNTDIFDKYGFWAAAILFGLFGGFLVGRLNKPKNTV
ncbi:hypothetical protein OAH87_01295 [Marinomonas sp.]|nr:hypothetical protein [Marinomonas sp.]MDB4837090.1 hypothetical protein [Marinomonas sp.]